MNAVLSILKLFEVKEMPLYTYRCQNCGSVFDHQQRMTDPALNECIVCQSNGVRRLVKNVGIVFKGSGFYVNDSRATTQTKKIPAGENKNGQTSDKAPAGETAQPAATTEPSSPPPPATTPSPA